MEGKCEIFKSSGTQLGGGGALQCPRHRPPPPPTPGWRRAVLARPALRTSFFFVATALSWHARAFPKTAVVSEFRGHACPIYNVEDTHKETNNRPWSPKAYALMGQLMASWSTSSRCEQVWSLQPKMEITKLGKLLRTDVWCSFPFENRQSSSTPAKGMKQSQAMKKRPNDHKPLLWVNNIISEVQIVVVFMVLRRKGHTDVMVYTLYNLIGFETLSLQCCLCLE